MELLEESADQSAITSVTSSPLVFFIPTVAILPSCLKARVVSLSL